MIKKILYIIKHLYNPYILYWYDLLTERHLKNRTGECINCFDCCKYDEMTHCEHTDIENKRCRIYCNRKCDEWFPISKKELDLMKKWKPWLDCKYSFIK